MTSPSTMNSDIYIFMYFFLSSQLVLTGTKTEFINQMYHNRIDGIKPHSYISLLLKGLYKGLQRIYNIKPNRTTLLFPNQLMHHRLQFN